MKPIYTCLWFKVDVLEVANYYKDIFKEFEILSANPMVCLVKMNGTNFMLLNGNSMSGFTNATSFVVECETQNEVDHYWEGFTKDGKESMCGWCEDKYGVSWQVVPTLLTSLMSDANRLPKVVKAFRSMKKFIIADLLKAIED